MKGVKKDMKKTYSKPQIMFEDFTLCTNIAAGCAYTEDVVPTMGEPDCGVKVDEWIIFANGVCQYGFDDGSYNNICYYVPNSSTILFGS